MAKKSVKKPAAKKPVNKAAKKAVAKAAPKAAKKAAPKVVKKSAPVKKSVVKQAPGKKSAPVKKSISAKAPLKKAASASKGKDVAPKKVTPPQKGSIKSTPTKGTAVSSKSAKPSKTGQKASSVKVKTQSVTKAKASPAKGKTETAASKKLAPSSTTTKSKVVSPKPIAPVKEKPSPVKDSLPQNSKNPRQKPSAKQSPKSSADKNRAMDDEDPNDGFTPYIPPPEQPEPVIDKSGWLTRTKFNDAELQEFRDIIKRKLDKAVNDYELLKDTISHRDNNGTDDTSPTFKLLEDGSEVMSKEETTQLALRQQKYIQALENAMVRIENKTYGICRATGQMISKDRLKSVPHATLSIEAKKSQQD